MPGVRDDSRDVHFYTKCKICNILLTTLRPLNIVCTRAFPPKTRHLRPATLAFRNGQRPNMNNDCMFCTHIRVVPVLDF